MRAVIQSHSDSTKHFVIFPDFIEHKTFASFKPVSAGFVDISMAMDEKLGCEVPIAHCYGESISLKIKSKEKKDDVVLNMGLRLK